ncbi:L,D-transpeptidase [Corynebacterium sp. ES2794-CONJ1]|uniref:L,D-transpeptidase n=1 Tax=unclassified Corynebacterium TaxID=2624378 RepID=UPI00216AA013|nr:MULTISPECIES: L,D-transpeptidase [unclassified Corynebacterium]MCS4489599.1 L,D-transpeptidase [Corynebacterium sp. ES2775-CONJ]MCS4491390.1 L,D-transpeptidase [Corynebacterium sp. ES2715-CONJ3]MCS4531509.1 L,D-transpeptidase [Corynebacterium sp. ES2730-CONJ]MCU9518897.1 L,D-transpeptidase [Corynebacterium sp. ES2794-CONJ1]
MISQHTNKKSATKRRVASAAAAFTMALGLAATPAAGAQDFVGGSSDILGNVREGAWQTRQNIYRHADATFNPQVAEGIKNATDGAVNFVFPGLIQERERTFDYGPCPKTARVCVDLARERAWLQEDGHVKGGNVRISAGAPGWETQTGNLRVTRKVLDEVSYVFNNAAMPYAIYFTHNGQAFHEGDPDLWSHGCIHLYRDDAIAFWNHLQVGDPVFIY